jgi:hypothetical protein
MAEIIYPAQFWPIARLPIVPNAAAPPADFSKEQANNFSLAIQILQLLHKPDGSRRSVYGLNRAAQHRWPNRSINSTLIRAIVDSWAIVGCKGIADMIRRGKVDFGVEGKIYGHIYHQLKSLAIVTVDHVGDNEEAFPLGAYLVELMEGRDPPARFYRVAAETQYGIFKFVALSHSVPEWRDVERYCLWHTRHELDEMKNE